MFGSAMRYSSCSKKFVLFSCVGTPAVRIVAVCDVAVGANHLRAAPIGLAQQVVHVGRDEVHDVEAHCLVLVHRDGVAHGVLGPVGVAVAQLGDAADVGDGVVRDLAPERALDVAAVGVDHGGGADRRVRRHRSDVAGHRDEGAG